MTSEPSSAPGGRPRLSPALVVEAAVRLVDSEGLEALSMRRLAASMGTEAMSLYRHVPSRAALLDAMVEEVVDELYGDPEVQLRPVDGWGWEEYLTRLAHGLRRLALRHFHLFPLVATRPPAAPWVRPPLRSLRWVEALLDALLSRGFREADAVYAYRAFTGFLLGHLLLEVAALGANTSPVSEEEIAPAPSSPLDGYPLLQRLREPLSAHDFAEEFEHSLGNLLERLQERVR